MPGKLFPSTLMHRDLEATTYVDEHIKIYIFPGLLLTSLQMPDNCTIPWPHMMAPQKTLSAFGQHSNVDRHATWSGCIEAF